MSATDELRKMLDERGVEWETDRSGFRVMWGKPVDEFHDTMQFKAVDNALPNGGLNVHICGCTPEQAIAATLGRPKVKARPYGYEPDTGAFDATRCECGCVNDISATYCNDCGGEIEIDMNAEKEIYRTPRHLVFAEKHDDGSLEFGGERYIAATLGSEVNGDTSDGYHTFDELYYHRTALFACLVALQPRQMAFKSWKHSDGTMYDGMFIAGIYTSGGWCTYHCEAKWWPLFDCHEQEFAPEWDGHTPSDAIHRLMSDFLPSQDVSGEVSE